MSAATLAAPRERQITRESRGLAIFTSALRWMAMVGEGEVLLHLTFGHASARDALAALRADEDAWQGAALDIASTEWNPALTRRLQAYADGAIDDFRDVPLGLSGLSPFQQRVVARCRRIPFAQTRTYGQLAALAGSPGAARAVGNVMASNQTPLVVPCHRVVAAGGKIGHYGAGGRRMKLRLLEAEAKAATRKS
jgi:methylated-DNA-[protein]-cysteine S-methyltransferase